MPFDPETLAKPNHDEFSRQRFVFGLKTFIAGDLTPGNRAVMDRQVVPAFKRAHGRGPENRRELRQAMERAPYHQTWSSLMLLAQEMMWELVEDTVDRQIDDLNAAAHVTRPRGSLRVNPKLEIPRYITAVDHHVMPGSYYVETEADDVRAGAIFDAGANMYHLGVRGRQTDVMGLTIAAVVRGEYPDLVPQRVLDMGCTIGQSTLAVAQSFPRAETHAIDVGAPVIRYGHARAEAMGIPVHFSQQNAEKTDFATGFFDLIVSHILFHETSAKGAVRILEETHRLLKPGGVMVHMEVPVRYRDLPLYDQVIRGWQTHYNAEPFWDAVCSMDLVKAAKAAGFKNARDGYVLWSRDPEREPRRLTATPNQGREWRYVLTARR